MTTVWELAVSNHDQLPMKPLNTTLNLADTREEWAYFKASFQIEVGNL